MKRVGTLLARSLIGALLLLALTANAASADPGHAHRNGAQPLLVQPEDPGFDGNSQGNAQPEDPGVAD